MMPHPGLSQSHGGIGRLEPFPITPHLIGPWNNLVTNAIFNPIGNPPPTIHWSKLRSPLPWQHRVEGNTLVIPRVAQQDSGQYICNATNTAGHAEATVILHVESKSSIPSPDFCLWCTGLYVPLPSSSLGRIPGSLSI